MTPWMYLCAALATSAGGDQLDVVGGVSSLDVTVHDVFDATAVARVIAGRTGLNADSWMETNAQLMVALASQGAIPWIVLGAATSGHIVGRRVRVPRCSGCASVVSGTAMQCAKCGATLRGDIEQLSDRLEAEEKLDADS